MLHFPATYLWTAVTAASHYASHDAGLSTATLFISGQENYKISGHCQDIKPCFQTRILSHSVTKVLENTADATNKLFKCDILFTFHSNCSIEPQVRQAHTGVHSLKHLMCLCTLDNVILSVKFSFLGSRF